MGANPTRVRTVEVAAFVSTVVFDACAADARRNRRAISACTAPFGIGASNAAATAFACMGARAGTAVLASGTQSANTHTADKSASSVGSGVGILSSPLESPPLLRNRKTMLAPLLPSDAVASAASHRAGAHYGLTMRRAQARVFQ